MIDEENKALERLSLLASKAKIDGLGLEGTISSQRLRGFDTAVRMMKE